jgi:hypothetical protein
MKCRSRANPLGGGDGLRIGRNNFGYIFRSFVSSALSRAISVLSVFGSFAFVSSISFASFAAAWFDDAAHRLFHATQIARAHQQSARRRPRSSLALRTPIMSDAAQRFGPIGASNPGAMISTRPTSAHSSRCTRG